MIYLCRYNVRWIDSNSSGLWIDFLFGQWWDTNVEYTWEMSCITWRHWNDGNWIRGIIPRWHSFRSAKYYNLYIYIDIHIHNYMYIYSLYVYISFYVDISLYVYISICIYIYIHIIFLDGGGSKSPWYFVPQTAGRCSFKQWWMLKASTHSP